MLQKLYYGRDFCNFEHIIMNAKKAAFLMKVDLIILLSLNNILSSVSLILALIIMNLAAKL